MATKTEAELEFAKLVKAENVKRLSNYELYVTWNNEPYAHIVLFYRNKVQAK